MSPFVYVVKGRLGNVIPFVRHPAKAGQ